MRFVIVPILLATVAAPAQATTPPDCNSSAERHFERLKDVPEGARQALAGTMADRNAPFQSTDVLQTPALPRRRFVSATQRGCDLNILYEQGGIALLHGTLSLRRDGSRWVTVADRRQGAGPKPAP